MFTGIIEEVGLIQSIHRKGQTLVLDVKGKQVLQDVQLGDSISVNGVCLTVTTFTDQSFQADVMPETFKKTSLRNLQAGSPVNLERAMAAGGRYGGHIVQGHVDGVGIIEHISPMENAVVYDIVLPEAGLMELILPSGSIAVDGISLTVVDANQTSRSLRISIIPHTLQMTSLAKKKIGDPVNIECDIIGKYVRHLLHRGSDTSVSPPASKASSVTEDMLKKHGFM
ncbi:riboflavin synthase [Marinicrinis sediminis]|uniref:Riboflavin synthase n=1 Tax=Marinicrinis sediminis TaxID=1652465 RepID=A0ABW5RCV0_9BACL